MQLLSFRGDSGVAVGVLVHGAGEIVNLSAAGMPADMTAMVALGAQGLEAARGVVDSGRHRVPCASIRILAPFPCPRRNIICVGKNYRDHASEFHDSGFDRSTSGSPVPDAPVVFTKAPGSVIGPGDPILAHLDRTGSVDYEVELAVIIGQPGRGITAERAFEHVYGYTIVNDVTARHLQQRHVQWFLGKSLDSFCPMGPVLVTADEIDDVRALEVSARVNGELRQQASVRDLIFDIPTLIETISTGTTLLAGDIIATGTPAGVGIGFDPPRFLQAGDVVRLEIDHIGVLENPVS